MHAPKNLCTLTPDKVVILTASSHENFLQSFKTNFKRVLTYWVQIGLTISAIGTVIGYLTLSLYTRSIGRPDLIAAAMDASSALVSWLAITAFVVFAYLFVLASTTVLYGLSVSLFNKSPVEQRRVALKFLFPVCLGMTAFIVSIYIGRDWNQGWAFLTTTLLVLFATGLLCFSSDLRKAVKTCAENDLPDAVSSGAAKIWFVAMVFFMLVATVVSAVAPAGLILKAYVGDGTRQNMLLLMAISLFAAIAALVPVIVFYRSKTMLFTRILFTAGAALVVLVLVINISPGGATMIVNSTASLMNARSNKIANYLIDDVYKENDFDLKVWTGSKTLHDRPLISGFPLFSFGDVLLLCPSTLVDTSMKDWPSKSAYCIVTKNSKVTRMPSNSNPQVPEPAGQPAEKSK